MTFDLLLFPVFMHNSEPVWLTHHIAVPCPLLQQTTTETSPKGKKTTTTATTKVLWVFLVSFHFILVILQGTVFCLYKTRTKLPRIKTLPFLFTSKIVILVLFFIPTFLMMFLEWKSISAREMNWQNVMPCFYLCSQYVKLRSCSM